MHAVRIPPFYFLFLPLVCRVLPRARVSLSQPKDCHRVVVRHFPLEGFDYLIRRSRWHGTAGAEGKHGRNHRQGRRIRPVTPVKETTRTQPGRWKKRMESEGLREKRTMRVTGHESVQATDVKSARFFRSCSCLLVLVDSLPTSDNVGGLLSRRDGTRFLQ